MKHEYDCIVVGGGPAGLQFAREVVSRSGFSVAVMEKNDELRENDKSTGGTFEEVVDRYGVPDEVIMAEPDSVTLESPNKRSRHGIESYVLDFPRFLDFLGEDAVSAGADVYTDTYVSGPIVEDGIVRGVTYAGSDGDGDVRAKITVDATGPNAVIASRLGFFDRDAAQRGIGLEFEAEGEYETADTLLLRFDHEAAPGGYAWTFPAGENAFKAGVCWVDDVRAVRGGGDSIHAHVERWVRSDPRWNVERVRAKHAGEGIWNDSMNQRATDGFVAVGDAVSSINPLFGEGIRPGMESAEMAADVALVAMDEDDVSESRLREYERRWNEERGRAWKLHRIVAELLYDFDEDQQDAFVERIDRLSPREAEQLRTYTLSPLALASLYPFKRKDATKLPKIVGWLT